MTDETWASIYYAIHNNSLSVLRTFEHELRTWTPCEPIVRPLYSAIIYGSFECAQWLVSIGSDIEHRDNGWTPLIRAVSGCSVPITKMLLAAGAKMEVTVIGSDTTALGLAYLNASLEVACVLIDHGAKLYPVPVCKPSEHYINSRRKIVAYYEARQQRRARERALMAGLRRAGAHKDSIRLFEAEMKVKK